MIEHEALKDVPQVVLNELGILEDRAIRAETRADRLQARCDMQTAEIEAHRNMLESFGRALTDIAETTEAAQRSMIVAQANVPA